MRSSKQIDIVQKRNIRSLKELKTHSLPIYPQYIEYTAAMFFGTSLVKLESIIHYTIAKHACGYMWYRKSYI